MKLRKVKGGLQIWIIILCWFITTSDPFHTEKQFSDQYIGKGMVIFFPLLFYLFCQHAHSSLYHPCVFVAFPVF